jgi:AcrR family transcriptional regulator
MSYAMAGGVGEREKLISGCWRAAAERGYRNVTVDHVLMNAGVSEAAFSDHFNTIERVLGAAQAAFLDRLWLEVVAACESAPDWPGKVCEGLQSVISDLAEASDLARAFIVEATSSNFASAERYFASLDQFASMLAEGRRQFPEAEAMPAVTERALIGGVSSVLSGHLLAENAAVLPQLHAPLSEFLLTPYVGPGEARRIAAG